MKLGCAAFVAVLALTSTVQAEPMSGRDYFHGFKAFAQMTKGSAGDLPADYVACSNCHGALGEGSQEGGVVVPPLQMARLLQPSALGSSYKSVDDVMAAIERGIGRDGRRVSSVMPRFTLTESERTALAAYLQKVGTADDMPAGVTADKVKFAVLLPLSGPVGEFGRDALNGMQRAVQDINAKGGVHGRHIELIVEDASPDAGVAAQRLVDKQVYLTLGGLWRNDSEKALAVLERAHVSVVAALQSPETQRVSKWRSYLFASEYAQSEALFASMRGCKDNARIALRKLSPESAKPADVSVVKTTEELADLLGEHGGKTCIGTSLAQLPELQRMDLGSRQEHIVVPFPLRVFEQSNRSVWQQLGYASAKVAIEALAEAGAVLHERAPIEALLRLPGFEALPGIPVRFSKDDMTAWRAEVMIIESQVPDPQGQLRVVGDSRTGDNP